MKVPLRYRLFGFLMGLLLIPLICVWFLVVRIISKKAAMREDGLFVKGQRVAPETIERLIVRVYWPYADYILTLRDHRQIRLWPEGRLDLFGRNLYAWAKTCAVSLNIEGNAWAIQAMEKRFTSPD